MNDLFGEVSGQSYTGVRLFHRNAYFGSKVDYSVCCFLQVNKTVIP